MVSIYTRVNLTFS